MVVNKNKTKTFIHHRVCPNCRRVSVQGYLTYKKTQPPTTLPYACVEGPMGSLRGGRSLMGEVPLYIGRATSRRAATGGAGR